MPVQMSARHTAVLTSDRVLLRLVALALGDGTLLRHDLRQTTSHLAGALLLVDATPQLGEMGVAHGGLTAATLGSCDCAHDLILKDYWPHQDVPNTSTVGYMVTYRFGLTW
jgi:hypothetical protein